MVTVPYSVDIYRIHHALAAPTAVKLGGDRLLQEGTDNPTSARGNSKTPGAARKRSNGAKAPLAPPAPKASSHRHPAPRRHDLAVAVLRAVPAEAASPELRVTRRTAAVTTSEPHLGWRRFLHDATTVPGVPRSIINMCEGATGVRRRMFTSSIIIRLAGARAARCASRGAPRGKTMVPFPRLRVERYCGGLPPEALRGVCRALRVRRRQLSTSTTTVPEGVRAFVRSRDAVAAVRGSDAVADAGPRDARVARCGFCGCFGCVGLGDVPGLFPVAGARPLRVHARAGVAARLFAPIKSEAGAVRR